MSLAQETSGPSNQTTSPWSIEPQVGKLILKHRGVALTVFHYQDDQCLRPFFSNVRTLNGTQVTRNHPPSPGVDPDDHADMHCGIWLGFGDIDGHDFWRNKARIRHRRFLSEPILEADRIGFTSEDELIDPLLPAGELLFRLFHEDGVRVFEPQPLKAACRCSQERILGLLASFSAEERADMVEADGRIRVS